MNATTTQDLNLLDDAQIVAWLREALHGRLDTRPLTRDEPAHQRVLRTERRLERAARAAIRRASEALAHELPAASAPELDYVESLLHLLSALRRPVAPLLMQMARDWPAWIRGNEELQRVLLATIVDLQESDARAFWLEIVRIHGATFSATAFAGIFLHAPEAALEVLPTWPVNALTSRVIGVLLGQKLGSMAPVRRHELLTRARDILDSCAPPLRGALERAVNRYAGPPMTGGRERPHASFRAALRSRFPESGRYLGIEQSPRLVPVAA